MIADNQLKQLIEAAIFAADDAVTIDQLLQGVLANYRLNRPRVRQVIDQLMQDYKERGVVLVEVASGFRFQTRAELGSALAHMWSERAPRYSAALLETLALIAWRQPITRGDIEAVRGVSVSTQIMRTLQDRGWVKVVGQKEVPGRPSLYATTKAFLDYFSIQSIADLPALAQERPQLLLDEVGPSSAATETSAASEQLKIEDHSIDDESIEDDTTNDTRERGDNEATLH